MVFNKIHFSTSRCEMLNILYNNIRLFFADIKVLNPQCFLHQVITLKYHKSLPQKLEEQRIINITHCITQFTGILNI